MSTVTGPRMTADEFLKTWGGDTYVDLVNGEVEFQPMPHKLHGTICSNLVFEFMSFVRPRDLGRVMTCDTFVRIRRDPDTLRGADVMYQSFDSLPRGRIPEDSLDVPPELVAEVRSPSNTWAALNAKADEYLSAGVLVVLLIDADAESVTVRRANELPQPLHNGDVLTLPDVLPGFSVAVKKFFE